MDFTPEQNYVIENRDHNLLVSAAAGSGKTAVLVERIVKRVTDPDDPVKVDSIVVVTFTKAAAAEMKQRLTNALEENPKLIKQLSLVDNAHISTIDSFCAYIVRNYYNVIGLDPSFRVADEGEIKLLAADAIKEVIENHFRAEDKDFIAFVEAYSPGKRLDDLIDTVQKIHKFAQSNPWPLEWLNDSFAIYENPTEDEFDNSPLVQMTANYIKTVCEECLNEYDRLINLCNNVGGFTKHIEILSEERTMCEQALEQNDFAGLSRVLNHEYKSMPKTRAECDSKTKDTVMSSRNSMKDSMRDLHKAFLENLSEQAETLQKCSAYAKTLKTLIIEYGERLAEKKSERNILDFNDLEHYALEILVNHSEDGDVNTDIANELAAQFKEIYIDEYQDSNAVQECILNAIAGPQNKFMVGDVKQSIYRFRMAKPELFMEKYDRYSNNPEEGIKVELHNNFRSRNNVLDCVNDIFRMSMRKGVGGVEYTPDVELYPGKKFTEEFDDTTEIMLYAEDDDLDMDKTEIYANMAALKIKNMMAGNKALNYSDFVILLRSANESGPVYSNVLNNRGIPCAFSSSKGYFDAFEVAQVMDLLRVIDNPRQDIPLAAAMRSYFGGFTADELALIKGKRKKSLYDCLVEKEDEHCKAFLALIGEYRNKVKVLPVHELLSTIVYDTGYYEFCGALNNGEKRRNNVKMLITKAYEYSKTSFCGLFNFLRYIEEIQKYEVEYGEQSILSETDNVVRIYSIHKSKGLQFPIVILGGSDKTHNTRDTGNQIIYDSDFGVAMRKVDLSTRIKKHTAYSRMLSNKMKMDEFGEELRLLYVALTRAEKKLIILGKKPTDKNETILRMMSTKEKLSIFDIMNLGSYENIVMPAAYKYENSGRYKTTTIAGKELMQFAAESVKTSVVEWANKVKIIRESSFDRDVYERICQKMDYVYPYATESKIHMKYSVSEIKHRDMDENDDFEGKVTPPELNKYIPGFIEEHSEQNGTNYGNAYHKFFEIMDYTTPVEEQLKNAPQCAEYVKAYKINAFLKTSIGQNMKKAHDEGRLFREQPFTILMPASEVVEGAPEDENVFMQGVIDAFYLEGDTAVIIDYKTDSVTEENAMETLMGRYAVQLKIYSKAVKQLTGVTNTRAVIYSVKLDHELDIIC